MNLMVFNLPECRSQDAETRIQSDSTHVHDILEGNSPGYERAILPNVSLFLAPLDV
ncbi:unnamed protein product [Acanthoscelides obtectus]|uniref:Uncharacterized protein n=1 Tax=Acanthoscelides obtectus TaxID=200917 RepID=A0A9P0PEH0_ACAOB|nr:unnamed protein product [Acanthoscelides obtectus]CAK1628581.1 hypothetical protein AOBTE_LOCUS5286 [Acanthoscelides obtectus]